MIGDLDRLASGLNPGMVREGSLREALAELVRGCGVAVDLELDADIDGLREDLTALVYFLVAECLTNVARHGRATRARVDVRARPTLVVEVRDDGRGGASIRAGRGLQGLADRVAIAGGRFEVASPAGGPTCVRAEIPQLDPLPPRASGLPGQDATGGLTGSG